VRIERQINPIPLPIKQENNIMTSKQRRYLTKLASSIDPVLQIGKAGITPEVTKAVDEALEARELIKLHMLKNCLEEIWEAADTLAERTRSQVVQVIGKKLVLYRESKTPGKNKILLPQTKSKE